MTLTLARCYYNSSHDWQMADVLQSSCKIRTIWRLHQQRQSEYNARAYVGTRQYPPNGQLRDLTSNGNDVIVPRGSEQRDRTLPNASDVTHLAKCRRRKSTLPDDSHAIAPCQMPATRSHRAKCQRRDRTMPNASDAIAPCQMPATRSHRAKCQRRDRTVPNGSGAIAPCQMLATRSHLQKLKRHGFTSRNGSNPIVPCQSPATRSSMSRVNKLLAE